MFLKLGAAVIDADQIAHQLTQSGQPALAAILAQFGKNYFLPDGNLDRARMRRLVFSVPEAKKKLETLLHPLIMDEVNRRLATVLAPYVLVAVPLLLESGAYRGMVQRILVVDCSEAQQVERVVTRSGLGEEEVRAIMAHQIGRDERLRLADDILDNHGDLTALQEQVERLHRKYLRLAGEK